MNRDFKETIKRSLELRKKYHDLENKHHGSEWSIEEDALAYLTDAALVGRNIMSYEKRWPKSNTQEELAHKLGENIWWLIVIAQRCDIDIEAALEDFLSKTEALLNK